MSFLKTQFALNTLKTFSTPFSTLSALSKSATKSTGSLKTKGKGNSLPYKRASSAFLYFNQDYHHQHKEEFKGLKIDVRAKQVSEAWNQLSEAEKEPYQNLASKDYERFLEEKAKYEASKPPKRPISGYLQFYSNIRPQLVEEHPGATLPEIGAFAGQRWRALLESEKEEYNSAAKAALEAWKTENAKL